MMQELVILCVSAMCSHHTALNVRHMHSKWSSNIHCTVHPLQITGDQACQLKEQVCVQSEGCGAPAQQPNAFPVEPDVEYSYRFVCGRCFRTSKELIICKTEVDSRYTRMISMLILVCACLLSKTLQAAFILSETLEYLLIGNPTSTSILITHFLPKLRCYV